MHHLVEIGVPNIEGDIVLPLDRVGFLLLCEGLFVSLLLLMVLPSLDMKLQVVA